jgi:peptide/nickel transport system substrate-binding protein
LAFSYTAGVSRARFHRIFVGLGAVAAAAWLACRHPPETAAPPPAPPPGGSATLASAADLASINELLAGGSQVSADLLRRQLFATLFEEQADFTEHPPTFEPGLAESWEWSDDHLTLTVKLRPAVWSDGESIDAADVVFTWQAQTSPAIAWDQAFAKENITEVTALDPRTVRYRFRRASLTQLADVNDGVILPRHAWSALPFDRWRKEPAWFREHLVTSGPFLLERWTPQQEIVLARNPRYFRAGMPRLDRVVWKILPDRESQIVQLASGELDYMEALTPREAERLATAPVAQHRYWSRQYNYLAWNTRRAWLADTRVRRALTLALDRQGLVDALAPGLYRIAVSPVPASLWAHDRSLAPLPFDPAAARRELASAGFADRDGDGVLERDGKPLRLDLVTNASSPIRVDALSLIAVQLRKVGIDARAAGIDFNLLLSRAQAGDFDGLLLAWGVDTSLDISYAFETASPQNWGAYSDPTLDKLFADFRQATSAETALPTVHRIERRIHDEQPYTFLWEAQRIDVANRRLIGVKPNALSPFANLREWGIAPP